MRRGSRRVGTHVSFTFMYTYHRTQFQKNLPFRRTLTTTKLFLFRMLRSLSCLKDSVTKTWSHSQVFLLYVHGTKRLLYQNTPRVDRTFLPLSKMGEGSSRAVRPTHRKDIKVPTVSPTVCHRRTFTNNLLTYLLILPSTSPTL